MRFNLVEMFCIMSGACFLAGLARFWYWIAERTWADAPLVDVVGFVGMETAVTFTLVIHILTWRRGWRRRNRQKDTNPNARR